MKTLLPLAAALALLASSALADNYIELSQTAVTKPDGTIVVARTYRSEPTGLWSSPIFVVEIDGMKEIVGGGGFGHGWGPQLQSANKREFVQMAAFEGGARGGAVFDLVTHKSWQLSDWTWKEHLLKQGYVQLRPPNSTQPATKPAP